MNSTATSAALGGASPGAAGSIAIDAQQVELSGAQITAFAQEGPAPGEGREGNIAIAASDSVVLRDGSQVTSSVGEGLGGNISVAAGELLVLEGGSTILAETQNGTGGAIALAAEGVIPQLARVSGSALESADFVPGVSGARISADAGAGTSGTVATTSPEVDVESQVAALDVSFLDASTRLQRACAARASGAIGSFRVARERAAPSAFDDLAPLAGRRRCSPILRAPPSMPATASAPPRCSIARRHSSPRCRHRAPSPSRSISRRAASGSRRRPIRQRAFALLVRAAPSRRSAQGDAHLLSFALGDLGALYAAEGRTREALYLTRRALEAAERTQASSPAYRWHWQEGRLSWAEGRADAALKSYARAVEIIEASRSERVAESGAASVRFRRGGARLRRLRRRAAPELRPRRRAERATGAAGRGACGDGAVQGRRAARLLPRRVRGRHRGAHGGSRPRAAAPAPTAAVVYPIVLADRLELLVSLPEGLCGGASRCAPRARGRGRRVPRWRAQPGAAHLLAPAQQLYGWLVAPYADALAAQSVDTLVFVPDAKLRTVPMAALHDGKRFLIERYALAVTPGFSLIDRSP